MQDIRIQVSMAPTLIGEAEAADSLENWAAVLDIVTHLEDGSAREPTTLASVEFARIHDLVLEEQLLNRLDAHSGELRFVGEQLIDADGTIDDDLLELRTSLIVISAMQVDDSGLFRQLMHGLARIFNDCIIAIVPEDHALTADGTRVDELRRRRVTAICRAAGFAHHRGGLMLLPHAEQLTS